MNKKQLQTTLHFLQQILFQEEMLEKCKKQLINTAQFNPLELFEHLADGKPAVTITDFHSYLSKQMPVSDHQMYQVFVKFDWKRQGEISKGDFIKEVFPCSHNKKMKVHEKSHLTSAIHTKFLQLIDVVVRGFRVLEIWRKQLSQAQLYAIFEWIDWRQSGIIGLRQLSRIFNSNHFALRSEQQRLLLHGLRRRSFKQVNLEVFSQNVRPMQFGYYPAYAFRLVQSVQLIQDRRLRQKERINCMQDQQMARRKSQLMRFEVQNQAQLTKRLEVQNKIHDLMRVDSAVIRPQRLSSLRLSYRSLQKEWESQFGLQGQSQTARKAYELTMNRVHVLDSINLMRCARAQSNKQNKLTNIRHDGQLYSKHYENPISGLKAQQLMKRIAQSKLQTVNIQLQSSLSSLVKDQIYDIYGQRNRYI